MLDQRRLLGALCALLIVVLSACAAPAAPADSGAASEDAGGEAVAETFRVAIVMPSTITDLAWSQAIYDGLVAVQAEMGGEEAMEKKRGCILGIASRRCSSGGLACLKSRRTST